MVVERILVLLCFMLLCTSEHSVCRTTEQESDRITALPGQPPVNFSQFSGYINVNEERGRALFYWLTEAKTHPKKRPLVLWLNGGPGCSSIAYGASEELGPFRINKTGSSLYLTKHSWNKVANIIFLESPAGVGFSYTNTTSELKDAGDERTAQDSLAFLMKWFARFPQYNHREFYLAGESYAGHYVPQLAKKIVDHNKANPQSVINFQGFIVGNACMDKYYDELGTITYWWSHSMISDHTYENIMSSCRLKIYKPQPPTKKCRDAFLSAYYEIGKIDQYSIYTKTCNSSSPSKISDTPLRFKNSLLQIRSYSNYDPCSENYAEKYYNTPEVQKALHANTTKIAYKWTACSDVIHRNWKGGPRSMLPTYKELMAAGLRIWVYSGDTDSIIPATATRLSLKHLHLKIKIPWYPWYLEGQVGGWTEIYDGLTYVTIRGAGHEVPHIRPKRAFRVFKSFLAGKQLPEL